MSAEGTEEEEWLYGESATVISVAPAEVKPELEKIIPGASEDAEATEGGEIPVSTDDLIQEGLDIEGLAAAEAPSRKRGLNDEDGPEPNEDGERSEGEAPGSDKPESGEEGEDSDSDDEEDSVQVVIGDFKGQGALTAKRTGGPPPDKKGKFSTEDFESSGQINGVPAHEFSLDAIDEKPWRKPGADITDYFNYGFTEDTWRAYCDRQRRLRYESGTTVVVNSSKNAPQQQAGLPVSVIGEGRKYGGDRGQGPQNIQFPKRMQGEGPGMGMGPPGMRKDGMMGMGPPGMGMGMGMGMMQQMPMGMRREDLIRENSIQVMTADRREYSRKPYDMGPMGPGGPGPFDMSVPPPSSFPNRDFMGGPPPDFYNHPPPQEYYIEDEQPDYEEQQWMDSQWEMEEQNLRVGPSSALVVPLTKVAVVPPPPGDEDLPSSPATDVEKKVNPEPK